MQGPEEIEWKVNQVLGGRDDFDYEFSESPEGIVNPKNLIWVTLS
jgi:hypothetical protein